MHVFVQELEKLVLSYKTYKVYHYCSTDYAQQANAAFLMGCFMIIILKKTADEAWAAFSAYHSKFVPYRDAIKGNCSYKCTIHHCLLGL